MKSKKELEKENNELWETISTLRRNISKFEDEIRYYANYIEKLKKTKPIYEVIYNPNGEYFNVFKNGEVIDSVKLESYNKIKEHFDTYYKLKEKLWRN